MDIGITLSTVVIILKSMIKYDSDFINPYIERYANGDFTENENKVNQEINTDYMINFAQKMLEIK